MSLAGDQGDNWRGSYDGWLATDRRDVPSATTYPFGRSGCRICGANKRNGAGFLICHTAQERDAAANAERAELSKGWRR